MVTYRSPSLPVSLCVLHERPRVFDCLGAVLLQDVAQLVADILHKHRQPLPTEANTQERLSFPKHTYHMRQPPSKAFTDERQ